MTLDSVANLIKLTVSQGYDESATSIVLSAGGSSLPTAPFNMVYWNVTDFADPSDDPNVEIVRVTAVSGNTLTVERGQEGTVASTKNTAGKTYRMILGITAKMITDIGASLQKPWQYVDVQGTIDGNNTVFTISPVPFDSASVQLRLARQPQEQGIDYTILGGTITYITAPPASLSSQPHTAQYQ
jgi:hypothetical protein